MRQSIKATPFMRRFSAVRSSGLRMQVLFGLAWTVCVAGSTLLALAAADYTWELPFHLRATGLCIAVALTLLVGIAGSVLAVRRWNRSRTARDLEHHFPQLGQRVRTVVQFSRHAREELLCEGIRPELVAALEEETDQCARPLDVRAIVPRLRTAYAALLALIPVALILGAYWLDWQWRMAIQRAMLSNRPYTTLAVAPGDMVVNQGEGITLSAVFRGRAPLRVTLRTRNVDEPGAPWQQEELGVDRVGSRSPDDRQLEYAVALHELTVPFDYQFVAGTIAGDVHHILIRHALALKTFEAAMTAPAYTGLQPKIVPGGNLDVIEGSDIRFRLVFDRDVSDAYLLVSDPPLVAVPPTDSASALRVPLEPTPDGWVARLPCRDTKVYSIVATAREGAELPKNEYHIRVRKDQAPLVHFEDPPEAWEVNPIAEVPMRVRINDDFGLRKAGIVFQIDGGDEQVLLSSEYDIHVEPDANGQIHLTTHAALAEMLYLEKFPVKEDSAVTYYAFVEDNHPDTPHRVESDLRFIEIRPFRRFFQPGGT
jgi:hypothetical protein